MISEKKMEKILKEILEISPADQTEVLLISQNSALTRFANNQIHQNVAEKNARLSIRVIKNKRTGTASTNILGKKSIKEVLEKALKIADNASPDPDFKSLPKKKKCKKMDLFSKNTAEYQPIDRAKDVSVLISKANQKKLNAAGALSTGEITIGIANSLGVFEITSLTEADINTVFMSSNSSGYADYYAKEVRKIDFRKLADIASEKALRSIDPIAIDPGFYTVILEPAAVADMLTYLAFCGLGALAYQEGRSFISGKLGEKITGENITIWDDGTSPDTLGIPFDFEGTPKQRVMLIENGVAKNVVYDSYTAHKESKESTGHALPAPNIYGPQPSNLFLKNGDYSVDEMIASTKKGILVTRFHYTNMEDPLKTMLTGMTRDGTFLIEDGEISCGIKNLRFTQNILKALSNVEMISEKTELKQASFGFCLAPTLKVKDFNFTGVTEF